MISPNDRIMDMGIAIFFIIVIFPDGRFNLFTG